MTPRTLAITYIYRHVSPYLVPMPPTPKATVLNHTVFTLSLLFLQCYAEVMFLVNFIIFLVYIVLSLHRDLLYVIFGGLTFSLTILL